MENDQPNNNQNGRRQKKSKWNPTKKIKMKDNQKNSKWKKTKKIQNKRRQKNLNG